MNVRKAIDLASQSRIERVAALAPRFFRAVVGWDYDDCLVTDMSDLRDFVDIFGDRKRDVDAMLDRLEQHYFVDGQEVGSTRIVDLLELIALRGVAS